jgi:hypothetical protein
MAVKRMEMLGMSVREVKALADCEDVDSDTDW